MQGRVSAQQQRISVYVLATLVPLVPLELAQFAFERHFSLINFLLRWLFVATLIAAVTHLHRWAAAAPRRDVIARLLVITAVLLLAMLRTRYAYSDSAALIGLWVFFLLLVQLGVATTTALSWWQRLPVYGVLAGAAGIAPITAGQLESHFAEEEFFVAGQAALLGLAVLLVLLACRWSTAHTGLQSARKSASVPKPGYVLLALLLGGLVAAPFVLRAYQASFYAQTALSYPNLSPDKPFLCGVLPAAPETVEGSDTFQALLAAIANSAYKDTPDYGLLALSTQEERWVQAFRASLLTEVREERYTGPVNSVKWEQHAAALRVYYFDRMQRMFPQLFTPAELDQIKAWFAAINRRALTVEWVDWMYALAFKLWPQGPYENQEAGAGLLAVLEATDLAAPELRGANQAYLEQAQRGWALHFRNTDDTYIYQFQWITNAYLQQLWTNTTVAANQAHSFEWLLLQLLPDGTAPYYNHISTPSPMPILYLGAALQHDARFIWLAAQSLRRLHDSNGNIHAQPGVEKAVNLTGQAPTQGSCLLYGDSGLPNQAGPLAPDKIVLRDGWTDDSAYLLLNLRFSGWHRYKATNTVAVVYQGERIVTDVLEAEPIRWLPVGRSLFRDKRIPRENLNGLLIENSGWSAALYRLTGIGSAWAQDPPHYAEVIDFQTGQVEGGRRVDRSHTRVTDWRGWRHDRWISLYAGGPIVVIDRAEGSPDQRAGLTWHLVKAAQVIEGQGRIRVRGGDYPLILQLIELNPELATQGYQVQAVNDHATLLYRTPRSGQLQVASLFLPGKWAEAEVQVDQALAPPVLRITQGTEELIITVPDL